MIVKRRRVRGPFRFPRDLGVEAACILIGACLAVLAAILGDVNSKHPVLVSVGEAVIIGILVALVGLVVAVRNELGAFRSEQRSVWIERAIGAELVDDLGKIEEGLVGLGRQRQGPDDLFVAYFAERLRGITMEIEDANEREVLTVREGHLVRSEQLVGVLRGGRDKDWRFTWGAVTEAPLFFRDPDWTEFFGRMLRECEAGGLGKMLCLAPLLPSELKSEAVALLQRLFRDRTNCEIKFVDRAAYDHLALQSKLEDSKWDFSVYGESLYFVCPAVYTEFRGRHCRDREGLILRRTFYDMIWESDLYLVADPPTESQLDVHQVLDLERAKAAVV